MTAEIFTIAQATKVEYEIKKSRFIGAIFPCASEHEALTQLRQLVTQHPHANHLAFAWRIRQEDGFINERCNDGGEPSGTAGRPILAPLEGESLINTVVGVIRYFGGIKLGTGGLTRAYGTAAKNAMAAAKYIPWVEMTQFTIEIAYSQLQALEYQLNKCHGQIIDQQFSEHVVVTINLPAVEKAQIQQQFSSY